MIALPSSISAAPCGYTKPLAQASAQPSAASLGELQADLLPSLVNSGFPPSNDPSSIICTDTERNGYPSTEVMEQGGVHPGRQGSSY